jgi:hypothetical protein
MRSVVAMEQISGLSGVLVSILIQGRRMSDLWHAGFRAQVNAKIVILL